MEKPKILSESVWKRIAQVLCDDAIAGFRASSLELAGRIRNEVEAYYEPLIQQARREIFEEIEGLVMTVELGGEVAEAQVIYISDCDGIDKDWQSLKSKWGQK